MYNYTQGEIAYMYDWSIQYKEISVIVLEQPHVSGSGRAMISVYSISSGKVFQVYPEELYRTKSGAVI
jgi:hypothetical protein